MRAPAKAFVSYSTKDKAFGAAVKQALEMVGTVCFLAHDDLKVSEEWRDRILEELLTCDIFIPLLSQNFRDSEWAPQEIGVVVARRDVVIAPLSLDGTTPFGFIANLQGSRVPPQGVTWELLIEPLLTRHPAKLIPGMIRLVESAGTFRGAEAVVAPLVSVFGRFSDDDAREFAEAAVSNGQVWMANLCRSRYLPEFIRTNGSRVPPATLRALQYQITHDERYPGDEG
jgi:hypothetical protein